MNNNPDMQACLNHNITTQGYYSAEQLQLPLDLGISIDSHDPLWSFLSVMRRINLNKYLKSHRGNQGYNDQMLCKAVLFAYMNRIYSLRDIEQACRTDLRFLYLTRETKPSFMAFQRFISTKFIDFSSDLFTEINDVIANMDHVNTHVLFLDGTKLEANANKFTFVWKKTAEKTLGKELERAAETLDKLREDTGYRLPCRQITADRLDEILAQISAWCHRKRIVFVYGTGRRKTEVQRHYDELLKEQRAIIDCQNRISACGPVKSLNLLNTCMSSKSL